MKYVTRLTPIAMVVAMLSGTSQATEVYIDAQAGNAAPTTQTTILDFDIPLSLLDVTSSNTGFTIAQRRAAMDLVDAAGNSLAFNASDTDLTNLGSLPGNANYFLYKYLNGDTTLTSNTTLGTVATGTSQPLVLDLGESDLTVTGSLEGQGVHYVTNVNSFASNDGLVMDGVNGLGIDAATTGQVSATELVEQTSGTPGNFKILLDMNSTLEDGANFVFAQETAGTAGQVFSYSVADSENSRLYDTSYVINSSAARTIDSNDNESVVVTFNRANNEYILKSFTDNHHSNDAALKLGTIAADGVALGDMQTALTRLDINDFGYGDTADNLRVEVKRLAPIANHSEMIAVLDSIASVSGAIEQRFSVRRGNWTGYSDLANSVWVKTHGQTTQSSGSVPESTPTAQDTAGHNGFHTNNRGITAGIDHRFANGLVGLSTSKFVTQIDQIDDRLGEGAKQKQSAHTLYGRLNGRNVSVDFTHTYASGDTVGERKTAIDRVADYSSKSITQEAAVKFAYRMDMSDGRSAFTPYLRLVNSEFDRPAYTETGAGDLSLHMHDYLVNREAHQLGAEISHKGRYFGVKGISALNISVGQDKLLGDTSISANYTGDTHTNHASYTSFVTPTERWSEDVVKFRGMIQVEPWQQTMVRFGLDLETRNSRQSMAVDFSITKAF